jgi:hypothetical protein
VAIEWAFAFNSQLWPLISWKRANKVLQGVPGSGVSTLSTEITLSFIFTNIHSCIAGSNQTAQYFDLEVPTLRQYLNGVTAV